MNKHGCAPHDHPRRQKRPVYSDDAFERAAAFFRAAGDVERLRMLSSLATGERCVSDLAEEAGGELSTVSQRLKLLRQDGLVVRRREGKHVFYALADKHVEELIDAALDHASHHHELSPHPSISHKETFP